MNNHPNVFKKTKISLESAEFTRKMDLRRAKSFDAMLRIKHNIPHSLKMTINDNAMKILMKTNNIMRAYQDSEFHFEFLFVCLIYIIVPKKSSERQQSFGLVCCVFSLWTMSSDWWWSTRLVCLYIHVARATTQVLWRSRIISMPTAVWKYTTAVWSPL